MDKNELDDYFESAEFYGVKYDTSEEEKHIIEMLKKEINSKPDFSNVNLKDTLKQMIKEMREMGLDIDTKFDQYFE